MMMGIIEYHVECYAIRRVIVNLARDVDETAGRTQGSGSMMDKDKAKVPIICHKAARCKRHNLTRAANNQDIEFPRTRLLVSAGGQRE